MFAFFISPKKIINYAIQIFYVHGYAPVKGSARDVGWWSDAPGRAVKVVHALLPHLPEWGELRIVLLERELGEVLRSQRTMLERAGEVPDRDHDAALERVFEAQLAEARGWAATRPRTALLPVAHRSLIEAPADVVPRVEAFLGGDLDADAMIACVDPTLYRSREAPLVLLTELPAGPACAPRVAGSLLPGSCDTP